MINYLKGEIIDIDERSVSLAVNNVGYEVYLHLGDLTSVRMGDIIEIYIYSHIKEDQFTLFGFKSKDDRELFRKLISVSGVGPKSALSLLSVASSSNIIRAIEGNNIDMLPKVPGLGSKTIQKIILELKGKLNKNLRIQGETMDMADARLALESLGYNSRDIYEVINTLQEGLSMNEIIKESLKVLSKVK